MRFAEPAERGQGEPTAYQRGNVRRPLDQYAIELLKRLIISARREQNVRKILSRSQGGGTDGNVFAVTLLRFGEPSEPRQKQPAVVQRVLERGVEAQRPDIALQGFVGAPPILESKR
jgi:hypothetical protein